MSQHLYLTRLRWDGHAGRGEACHDGVCVELRAAPDIGIAHLRELEYAPAVRVAAARVSADATRELSIVERLSAQAFVERVATAARAALQPIESHL
jgi:hypothetical protein